MKHEYSKLNIWIKSRELNKQVYILSDKFPATEKFGLRSQIRRSAVSIPSNIAEGSGYESNAQFLRFLHIAMGSLCELETQIYLALDLSYFKQDETKNLILKTDELKRMIINFKKRLS